MYKSIESVQNPTDYLNNFGSSFVPAEQAFSISNIMQNLPANTDPRGVFVRSAVKRMTMSGAIDYGSNQPIPGPAAYDNFSKATTRNLLRGQLSPGGNVDRWETMTAADNRPAPFFFNVCSFPTVIRYSIAKAGSRARDVGAYPVGYRVCYSSFQPLDYATSPDVNPDQALLPHRADWLDVKLDPDSGSNQPITVHVDKRLIGDNNCFRSLLAALQNSFAVDGSWLYFYPDVSENVLHNNPIFRDWQNHKITGASLGMAVFACVSGWENIFYTGFVKYLLPGQVIAQPLAYKSQVEMGHINPEGSWTGYGTNPPIPVMSRFIGMVKVAKQLNFVENVDDVILKIGLVTRMSGALVFPAHTDMGSPMYSYLNRPDNMEKVRNWLRILPEVYTMSMAQDGVPLHIQSGNNNTSYSLFMGSTVSEFSDLSQLALYSSLVNRNHFIDIGAMAEVQTAVLAWVQRQIQLGKESAGRGVELGQMMKSYRAAHDEKLSEQERRAAEDTFKGIRGQMDTRAQQRKAVKTQKVDARKQATKTAKTKAKAALGALKGRQKKRFGATVLRQAAGIGKNKFTVRHMTRKQVQWLESPAGQAALAHTHERDMNAHGSIAEVFNNRGSRLTPADDLKAEQEYKRRSMLPPSHPESIPLRTSSGRAAPPADRPPPPPASTYTTAAPSRQASVAPPATRQASSSRTVADLFGNDDDAATDPSNPWYQTAHNRPPAGDAWRGMWGTTDSAIPARGVVTFVAPPKESGTRSGRREEDESGKWDPFAAMASPPARK